MIVVVMKEKSIILRKRRIIYRVMGEFYGLLEKYLGFGIMV